MTAPTHTRAEVERLAAEDEREAASISLSPMAKFIGPRQEDALRRARQFTLRAFALRQLAASIGAEPVAGDPGWLKTELDSIGPETERWSDGLKASFNSHTPGTFPSPTYREGELSGIEKAALDGAHFSICYRYQGFIAADPPMSGAEAQWRVWHLATDARAWMTSADQTLYDALMKTRPGKEA